MYLFIIDVKMLILIMENLDKSELSSSDPEDWGFVLQVAEVVVELGDAVGHQAEVGTDAVGLVLVQGVYGEHGGGY